MKFIVWVLLYLSKLELRQLYGKQEHNPEYSKRLVIFGHSPSQKLFVSSRFNKTRSLDRNFYSDKSGYVS